MNWKVTHKRTGNTELLTDAKKAARESHPATRGRYAFEHIQETIKEPVLSIDETDLAPIEGQKKKPQRRGRKQSKTSDGNR